MKLLLQVTLAIAKELEKMGAITRFGNNHWNYTSVQSILHNYTYTGNLLLQKTYRKDYISKRRLFNNGEHDKYHIEGSHEAIIDIATYTAVQEEYARRREKYYHGGKKKTYPLTGKIQCGICGKSYRHRISKGYEKWMCSTFNTYGKSACPSKQVPDNVLMEIARSYGGADEVSRIIANPENELVFILKDGTEHTHKWRDRSRSESWTDEMRERARRNANHKNTGK